MSRLDHEKASNGAGTVERRGKRWFARVSLPGGGRKRVPIPNSEKMSELMAREKAARLAEDVRTGKIVFDIKPRAKGGLPSSAAAPLTVRQLASQWTSGALFERFGPVNRLRAKASAKIDAWTLAKHVLEVKTRGPSAPAFGDLAIADVTTKDVIAVMGAQPKEQASQTRLHTYQRMRRLFDLAIFPLEIRSDTPVMRQLRPTLKCDKEFCYLFPLEFLALMRGTNEAGDVVIPLARRMLYALAVYTGFRRESLFVLVWSNLDAINRSLVALHTKTGRPAFAEGDPPSLFTLLEAYREHLGKPAGSVTIVSERAIGCRKRDLAKVLREDLKAVGVTRAMLFDEESPNIEPLRFHDTRATFEVWARRAGWSQDRIDRRTGHTSQEMANRYMRAARTLDELRFDVFPDLTGAIPELTALATPLAKLPAEGASSEVDDATDSSSIPMQCEGGDLNPYASYGASTSSDGNVSEGAPLASKPHTDEGRSVLLDAPKSATGQERDNVGNDAEDEEIERRIVEAELRGRSTVADALGRELERRRAARAGGLVDLAAARRRREGR